MTPEDINLLRATAFRTNLEADRMAYFHACSIWFQGHFAREMERADLLDAAVNEALERAAVFLNEKADDWWGRAYGDDLTATDLNSYADAIRAMKKGEPK